MSDVPNTTTTLTGLFKEVVGDGPIQLLPKANWCQRNIDFDEKDMVGGKFRQSCVLTHEHGVTYSKANNGAFAINEAVAAVLGDVQIEPSQLVIKAVIDYESAFRASKGGKKAFADSVGLVVNNMTSSLAKRLEIDFLYGQCAGGIGLVNAATSSTTALVVSEASYSPGIFSGIKGAYVQLINAAFAADEDTSELVASFAPATRTLTVTNNQTLDAGDVIAFLGQIESGSPPVYHSMIGLDAMSTTTSGTLFNINVGTYADSWQAAPEKTSTGQISMAKIMNGVAELVNRGCMEDLVCLLSPRAYEVLNTDMAALRRLDSSYRYSKAESGTESLCFYGQNGKLEIVPHLYVKWGDAFILPPKQMKRIGSTEITFKRPGATGDQEIFRESTTTAGFELRAYTAQALLPNRLNWLIKLSGLTYA
jgi:hypothetical protein